MNELDAIKEEKDSEESQFNRIKNIAKEAYRFIDNRKFKEAKEKFLELLNIEPSNTYGLVGMGDLLYKTHNYEEAIIYYKKCLDLDSTNKFSIMGLMNCYRDLKQLNMVIQIAEDFRHITMSDASILSRVADAHRKLKNFKESEIYYMSALQINPNDQYVIVGIGHLYFACQRYQDAIKWWEKLVSTQPNNIKILTEIGNSYRKIKDFDKAIEYYNIARNLDNNNFFALYGLAESYRGKKDFKTAIEYWENILKFDPHNKLIINRYADSLRGMGEFEKALESFNKILTLNEDYYALLGKASTLTLMGEYEKSLEIYNSLKRKDPLNSRPVLELADIYFHKLDEKEKAIRILEEFLKDNPSNTDVSEKLDQFTDHT
jgi:tetratricopeptide (TPR) repeat protein